MAWGAIESRSKKLRIDIINIRNEENIPIFITKHIEHGTYIVTDGWPAYNFLDGYKSVWTHEIHNHILFFIYFNKNIILIFNFFLYWFIFII